MKFRASVQSDSDHNLASEGRGGVALSKKHKTRNIREDLMMDLGCAPYCFTNLQSYLPKRNWMRSLTLKVYKSTHTAKVANSTSGRGAVPVAQTMARGLPCWTWRARSGRSRGRRRTSR